MTKQQINDLKQSNETVNSVNAIAKDVVIVHNVNTNVVEKKVNELTVSKSGLNSLLKLTEKSVNQRFKVIQSIAYSDQMKNFLNAANLKKEDFNKPNLFNCFTKVVTIDNEIEIVNFYQITKISETVKELTFEGKVPEINISICDKGFLLSTENNKITLSKNENFYTLTEIETLTFNQILSRLAGYKKQLQINSVKAVKDAENLLKPAKVEKAPKINFAKMTVDEFVAYQLTL